ncbi:WD repeat-containing protein RUP2 [Punica granatum]|uniref:Uncharacterized protein n=2 Tax=Punica granatum TaxID=22663 RepID=A0A218WUI1_PUNGR|nr:WD repeat-containing protein RUP2 [Punica granatum]OWM75622.1 hypothetical protein CDL15_Pgr021787 [Punica granatum]PKI52050.1 hypothetical protein CRG98_027466 [Punica granatum]
MGALSPYWSISPQASNCTFPLSSTTTPLPPPLHVWDMNNSSPQFAPTGQPPPNHNKQTVATLHTVERGCGARCEWDFTLTSTVSSSSSPGRATASDTLGVIEFDPSDNLVATGGISRKIRVYSLSSLVGVATAGEEGSVAVLDHASAYDYYLCTPAKLSSLRWKPDSGSRIIGAGDYDGVVTEYDLERRVPTFERDEHGGRRVWSMDYTRWDPAVGASGSDDGTVQVWDTRCEGGSCVATVRPGSGAAVCSVEFNPFGGALVAVGCADRKAYGYDARKLVEPVVVFDGHAKTVTDLRFLDMRNIVSASTDGCLKLWSVDDTSVIRTYRGHVNSRSFVGLSVWRNGGLLGCGSESNEVFVYDKRWGEPIWLHRFNSEAVCGGGGGFVSSVCWRQVGVDECTLVAGGSDGDLRVFTGKRK